MKYVTHPPEIGDFKFVKKFAFLPKKLYSFDMRNGNRYNRLFIWLQYYYEVHRYIYVTWSVPPRIGWSLDGFATDKMKKEIAITAKHYPLYGKYDALLKNDAAILEHKESCKTNYELKVKEFSEDRFLQGFLQGMAGNR